MLIVPCVAVIMKIQISHRKRSIYGPLGLLFCIVLPVTPLPVTLHLRGCSCSSSGRTDSAFTCHTMVNYE